MSTADWMKEIWDDIKTHEMWHIRLPGTHNSGVFSAWNTIGVRNQDKDIGEQLEGGIRVFDIRVTKGHGTYVMHHSGNYPPNSSQNLDTALKQMSDFVGKHGHEIFVVRLAPGYGSNLEPSDYPGVRKMILDYLESHLVEWSSSESYTPENIMSKSKNIILLSGVGKESGKESLFWDNGSNFLKDTWGSYQSDCENTPTEKIEWLKPHIEDALKSPPTRFLYASCMIWTINLYDAAKQWTNPVVCSWLGEWAIDPALSKGMNIFAVDYFDVWDNQFVNTVVALNKDIVASGPQKVSSSDKENDAPADEIIDTPHFHDSNSFNEATARKIVSDTGLSWHKYKKEYTETGALCDESMTELATRGIPSFITLEFLKWYDSSTK